MNLKEIQELVKLINKTDLSEFKMKKGDFELNIRTKNFTKGSNITQIAASPVPVAAPAPVAVAPETPAAPVASTPVKAESKDAESVETSGLLEVKSPIVGTFYRSPGPDKDVFVKVGDTIAVGDVVCIVEAMKLFNEIETEIAGKIVKVLVDDASPVEYDQVLFLVDPNA